MDEAKERGETVDKKEMKKRKDNRLTMINGSLFSVISRDGIQSCEHPLNFTGQCYILLSRKWNKNG